MLERPRVFDRGVSQDWHRAMYREDAPQSAAAGFSPSARLERKVRRPPRGILCPLGLLARHCAALPHPAASLDAPLESRWRASIAPHDRTHSARGHGPVARAWAASVRAFAAPVLDPSHRVPTYTLRLLHPARCASLDRVESAPAVPA